ncbi:hypothetical protein D3C81_1707470 [compost metagenome]
MGVLAGAADRHRHLRHPGPGRTRGTGRLYVSAGDRADRLLAALRPRQRHGGFAVRAGQRAIAVDLRGVRHAVPGQRIQSAHPGRGHRVLFLDCVHVHGGLWRHHAAHHHRQTVHRVDYHPWHYRIRHVHQRDCRPGDRRQSETSRQRQVFHRHEKKPHHHRGRHTAGA